MTEQRYRAVLEVLAGVPVTEVAGRYGVSRQSVHAWLVRYRDEGPPGLENRSHKVHSHPWQIPAELEAAVCELRRAHRKWGPKRLVWQDHGLIFASEVGTPMDPDNFSHSFVRLCERADLGHWHPHELRHSGASLVLAQGTPLHVVSEVLGHASIAITKDVYGHLLEGDKRAAAESMTRALFGG